MTAIPSHDEMVENVVAKFEQASHEQRLAGYRWYPMAGRMVEAIADETGVPSIRVAHALAALSPRNPWLWNVQDCYSYAVASRTGGSMPSATTFKRNQLHAWAALRGDEQPWLSAAPKVRAFVSAILGLRSAVVVDTWAYRVATGEAPAKGASFTPTVYAAIEAAYSEAAKRLGQDARDVQAVTWVVAQTEGLASDRRGRHDLAFKRGTGEFVRELFSKPDGSR